MIASGAPNETKYHAVYIAEMAFDMMDAMNNIRDPVNNQHLLIRIGVH